MNERGSVELLLMLGFVLILQIGLFGLSQKMSLALEQSYGGMDPPKEEESWEPANFEALGRRWPAPAPRVDFGADDQHERDAEALCYLVLRFGCAAPGKNFRCN